MSFATRAPVPSPVPQSPAADSASPRQVQLKSALRGHSLADQEVMLAPGGGAEPGGGGSHGPVQRSQGAGAGVQREGDGLPGPAEVRAVYHSWVKAIARSRGVPLNEDGVCEDARVLEEAENKTKAQVGPVAFDRWQNGPGAASVEVGTPTVTRPEVPKPGLHPGMPGYKVDEDDISIAGGKVPSSMEEMADHTFSDQMNARLRDSMEKLNQSALAIRRAVGDVEYQCQKLNMGTGLKGFLARMTAGSMGMIWGVAGRGAKYVKDKIDIPGRIVKEGILGEEPSKSVGEEAEELGGTASSSMDMITGRLQDLYAATRPTYAAFHEAETAFLAAKSRFDREDPFEEGVPDLDTARVSLEQMVVASKAYLARCEELGIPKEAIGVDKLGGAMMEGATNAIEFAVSVGEPPGVEAAAGEGAKKGIASTAKKALESETAEELVKAGRDAAAEQVVKQAGAAAR